VVHSLSTTKFFAGGWGDISSLNTETYSRIVAGVQQRPQDFMTIEWGKQHKKRTVRGVPYEICEGKLTYLGEGITGYIKNVPESCHAGCVWLMRPTASHRAPTGMDACVIQLAATGEQGKGYSSPAHMRHARPRFVALPAHDPTGCQCSTP
jgi:hypothetical protein